MSPACQASHASGVSFCSWRAMTIVCCTENFDSRSAMLISVPANSPALYRGSTPAAWRSAMTRRSHAERVSENSIINAAHRACALANSRWCSTSASINSAARPVFWSVDSPIPRTLQRGYDTPRSEREAAAASPSRLDHEHRDRRDPRVDGVPLLVPAARRWLAQDGAFGRRSESTRPRGGHRPLRIGRASAAYPICRIDLVNRRLPDSPRLDRENGEEPLRASNWGRFPG